MKGYLILDLKIVDFDVFREYIVTIPKFIEKHGGRYIVQGVEPEILEGSWRPDRVVIIEFPSSKKAKEFLNDPEAQPLFAIRHKSTESKLILAEGCF